MPISRLVTIAVVVGLLLLLDVNTRRERYRDPRTRPVRSAAIGAILLAGAWLVAARFGRTGLHQEQVLQAIVFAVLWFVAAALVGLRLQRK